MCGELRQLHDRIGATTVYVTHDQLEAMAMADQIAVMNHGVVEQIATPQQIYDAPASMFVADFIGSPPMSFLRFDGAVRHGEQQRTHRRSGGGGARRCGKKASRVRSRSARVPSMCCSHHDGADARAGASVRSTSGPRRSSRSKRSTARSRRDCRHPRIVGLGDNVGTQVPHRNGSPCSTRRRDARCACGTRSPPWLMCASTGLPSASAMSTRSPTLSLDIADGELVVLLGPTGAGKTTTLRLVAGLERPDAGRVIIGGEDVSSRTARGARRGIRVPAVFALSASDGLRQPRISASFPAHGACRKMRYASASRMSRRCCTSKASSQQSDTSVRWRDAACGDRTRIGARAVHLPHGRAAVVARRKAAFGAAARAEAHPGRTGCDHPLCHPRPDRSDDDGESHRRALRRPSGADRHAARGL